MADITGAHLRTTGGNDQTGKTMKATEYPSREEARQYRQEVEEAVAAARSDEEPEKGVLAWPAGLDRTILRGLPLTAHTRNCLLRTQLMEGSNALTVAEMRRTRGVGPTTVRNLLIAVDEFLRNYIETFEGRPGPADVAAWRLKQVVERLTPTKWAIVEQRTLRHPPGRFPHDVGRAGNVDRTHPGKVDGREVGD